MREKCQRNAEEGRDMAALQPITNGGACIGCCVGGERGQQEGEGAVGGMRMVAREAAEHEMGGESGSWGVRFSGGGLAGRNLSQEWTQPGNQTF